MRLNKPVVGSAATPDGHGYWLVATDGGSFAFGGTQFHGSTGPLLPPWLEVRHGPPARPGGSYWLVASATVSSFGFGGAHFYGSTGNLTLNSPIVGMAAAGQPAALVRAADGGIFAEGAAYYGSLGGLSLRRPIVGVAAERLGNGASG